MQLEYCIKITEIFVMEVQNFSRPNSNEFKEHWKLITMSQYTKIH